MRPRDRSESDPFRRLASAAAQHASVCDAYDGSPGAMRRVCEAWSELAIASRCLPGRARELDTWCDLDKMLPLVRHRRAMPAAAEKGGRA